MPDPFPIPMFRKSTECNLKKHVLTDADRIYMVQTLSTVLMTHVVRPTMSDCLHVSKALHRKFRFLGNDGSSEVTILLLIYCSYHFHFHRILGSGSFTQGVKTSIVHARTVTVSHQGKR